MNNKETYTYEIPDDDGVNGKTGIKIVNDDEGVYIEISRTRTTTSCTGIQINDTDVIDVIRGVLECK